MIKIEAYISLSREERRAHLVLSEPCLELGGSSNNLHHACRGILAYFLGTEIPVGRAVFACHACHNRKCASPKHIYWGTPYENTLDQIENGTLVNIHERMISKYGLSGWRAHTARAASLGGKGNSGKSRPYTPRRNGGSKPGRKYPNRKGTPRAGIKMPRSWPRRGSVALANKAAHSLR